MPKSSLFTAMALCIYFKCEHAGNAKFRPVSIVGRVGG